MARGNLSIHLAERPTGEIIPGTTFTAKTSPAPSPSDLKDGQILVEVLYLSLDPTLRAQLNDRRSYVPPVQIGAVMNGASVSRVLATRSKQVSEGDYVYAATGWTEYAILEEGKFEPSSQYPGLRQPQDMLSALGITGVTAWYGMTQIGDPKPGETVVVSGAAGATGSVAGQIAKLKGARVVGIAGSDDKCRWLTEELGFDAAVNYKAADFKQKFKEATPNYIDVYFDNVGGDILDMCLIRAKEFARFVECGVISQYNSADPKGIKAIGQLVTMRIKMQGFIIFDHREHFPRARAEISKWLEEGKLKKNETILQGGLRAAEQGLVDLYRGINTGKLMVEVKNPNETPSKL
ncbi:putative NADP-dependent oxidoreductase-like protein [Hapsidospora chrysogenum ATCC 11550]|uniref:Dehydrogenase FUB6 n=1 Tax=Hapsidospora chrysogenum (strain ATCC 11550 / CBS 779.69 / DSM 880 / IAM 14645 / JCM 23072 / IMI 49137) TaxID=857340 RepID=A0A086T9E5_HAPC1|nr:putative NADP-dependent oxidoreductase-like protein [Hapsidospora chrysogenum ATCC 11550]